MTGSDLSYVYTLKALISLHVVLRVYANRISKDTTHSLDPSHAEVVRVICRDEEFLKGHHQSQIIDTAEQTVCKSIGHDRSWLYAL